jgi:hypothetical protein
MVNENVFASQSLNSALATSPLKAVAGQRLGSSLERVAVAKGALVRQAMLASEMV